VRSLFLFCTLLIVNLYACQGGYASCVKKVKDADIIQNKSLYIPVRDNKLLVYSLHKPKAKILKYDPFLSLYLIEDSKKFPYPFKVNMRLQLGSAMVSARNSYEGKVIHNQIGLNQLATYSEKLVTPSLLTSSCCSLEGIVTPRGIIQKEYLKRFLSKEKAAYSDAGIRVKNEKHWVIVSASDPYRKNNPFKKGDCIVSMDGVKVKAASVFMRRVLFSPIGSKHTFRIKRNNKILTVVLKTTKRHGGGAISDTFLEQKGIYFDKNLRIVSLSKHFIKYGLLVGDRLMQVNGVVVSSQEELQHYIENFKEFSQLLFERRNFQFFVNIK